jgi:hypothetical protein
VLPGAFSLGMLTMCVACLWATAHLTGGAVVADFVRYLAALGLRIAGGVVVGGVVVWSLQGTAGPVQWLLGRADVMPTVAGTLAFSLVLLALSWWSGDSGLMRLVNTISTLWLRARGAPVRNGVAP